MTGGILDGSRVRINVTKWGLVLVLMLLLLVLLLFIGMSRGCDGVRGALARRLWWRGEGG